MGRIAAAVLAVWIGAAAAAEKPAVSLVVPFDGAVTRFPTALLVYRTAPGFAPAVTVGGRLLPAPRADKEADGDIRHLRVPLDEGKNLLVWKGPEGDTLFKARIFYFPEHLRKEGPPGSRRYDFHEESREALCAGCHPLPAPGAGSGEAAGRACAPCHEEVSGAKALHKPAAEHECLRCHANAYEPGRFRVNLAEGALCESCHPGALARLLGEKKFVHGPAAAGQCLVCHDPHGASGAGVLRNRPTELCRQCHEERVRATTRSGVHTKPECTGCHTPHAADNPALVHTDENALCLTCHPDPTVALGGHPLAGHPVSGPRDPSRPGKPLRCSSCHEIHGGRDVTQLKILENEAAQHKFCSGCHP